jgi:glycosyltransferase involved in cell wall biosynthesis
VSIVIPAYGEAAVIGDVIRGLIGAADWHEILVIDDGSRDDTAAEAAAAGATVIRHPYNKGNGAAVKTGIRAATGEFVLIFDADGQSPPTEAVRLVERLGVYDLVIAARSSRTQAGLLRRLGNGILNGLAGYLTGRHIPDLTSGFRGARRECLREFLHMLPNGFSTPTTTTLAFIKAGYNVTFEPVDAAPRAGGSSKIRLSRDGVKFLLIVLKIVTIFSPMRVFLPIAIVSFLGGSSYAAWTIAHQSKVTNSSVLLINLAVVVFLIGLVSEQVAAMRMDGRK